MSVQNAQGHTFAAADVSLGGAILNQTANTYTYTGTVAAAALLGAVTITSVTGNAVTYTVAGLPGTTLSGSVIYNDAGSILISTTINALGISATNLYLTNTAQGLATSLSGLAAESSASVAYTACYVRGTLVRTPGGQRAVEDLAVGDLVECLNGGVAAVRWVGRRSYGGRFLRANPGMRPVRFAAGSLGEGLPARDLLVSPKHSMLIDGVLLPAELLVNGSSITAETGMSEVEYFHVELPEHDAIWAEGVLSESFVDDGSRGMFHNADSFAAMYPEAGDVAPEFFAPRVESGPVLDAIRAKLALSAVRRAA